MLITKTFQLRRLHTARATENTHAALVLTLAMPLDRIDPYDRGVLLGYQDEEIRVTLETAELVDPSEPRPMEKLWSSDGAEERMRPGPTEPCTECGKVIGDDPDADFYAPIAGPTRAVCGDCSVKLDDESIAVESAATDADYDADGANEVAESEAPAEDAPAPMREAKPGDWLDIAERGDAALADGPMPERPADVEPVTTPTRRRR